MGERYRREVIYVRVTSEEKEKIKRRMEDTGNHDMNRFMRTMALNGMVININLQEFREYSRQIAAIGNNINQIARKVNLEQEIYQTDIDELKEAMKAIQNSVKACMENFIGLEE